MHNLDETFETDPPAVTGSSMDVDESQTEDPSELNPTSEVDEALEGNETATVDCQQDAKLDNDFGDLVMGTGVNEDTDDAACDETATESVKETPVKNSDALASDDKPETFPGDGFGDSSFSGVKQQNACSEKEGVPDNDTPFEDADTSISEKESSPDDDVGYLSAVDAISTGFNEERNAEDDESSNVGEKTDTKNEEEVPKDVSGTIADNYCGDFSGENANIHSEENDIDVLSGNSEDPKAPHGAFSRLSAEPIGNDNELIMDATENDKSAMLPYNCTDGGAILDEASGNEQIDLRQIALSLAMEDEMQVDAAQNTREALLVDVIDDQEEDFGDFGTFNEAAPSGSHSIAVPLMPAEQEAYMDSCDDNDFGDFGSFEQAQDPNQYSKVERVEMCEQTRALESSEQAGPNEDDDDFGEFGDFTDFAADQASQDVEGQVATDDSTPASRSIGDTSIGTKWLSSTTAVVDPFVQRAESVFLDVFGQGVEGGNSVEADRNAAARINFSIHSILVST